MEKTIAPKEQENVIQQAKKVLNIEAQAIKALLDKIDERFVKAEMKIPNAIKNVKYRNDTPKNASRLNH